MSCYDSLKSLVSALPDNPGVYQFFNKDGKIIYVGKAKNLKKRVTSYFAKNHDSAKVRIMVDKIAEIRHIVVESESDALLLENNLIKKYQPRYNILLKDDKTFPWICIKNERFPRVYSTRNVVSDGSVYFGPYTSASMVRTLLDLFKHLFPLRNCGYELSDEKIAAGKYRTCLEFHIGNCKAPCVGFYDEESYRKNIDQIKEILKGNLSSVLGFLKQTMISYASDYKYELAEEIKQKIQLLERFQAKSTVVNSSINNVDVFSIKVDNETAYVNFIKVINGAILQAHTIELEKRLDETPAELLAYGITELRQRLFSNAREILVPFLPEMKLDGVKFLIPKIGDKLKLLELSQRNVSYYHLEKRKQESLKQPKTHTERLLETIQRDLQLDEPPVHIECFDNSNIQGTNPVAACVVFKNARPSKRDYRHFNIKTVEGPNDFASMIEIVYRRYKRLIDENQSLPQLIVIDGGKGQLSAAVTSLTQLGIQDKVTIIGIAKRLEEIFFPDDPIPIYLDKNSETLKVIQHLRNEAHRFGITFHRQKRSKGMIHSELNDIQGIGPKAIELLFQQFKSIETIRQASIEELATVIGQAKAQLVHSYFSK